MTTRETYPRVSTRDDFVNLLRRLRESLRNNPDTWEHQDLDSFLEALAAWTHDMDGYFRRDGQPVPDQPTWDLLAQMVLAARVYE